MSKFTLKKQSKRVEKSTKNDQKSRNFEIFVKISENFPRKSPQICTCRKCCGQNHTWRTGVFSEKFPGNLREISGHFWKFPEIFFCQGGPVPEIAPRDFSSFFSKFTLNHLDFWPFFKTRLDDHFFDKFTLNAEGSPEGHFGGFSGGVPGPPGKIRDFGHFSCVSFDFHFHKTKKIDKFDNFSIWPAWGGRGRVVSSNLFPCTHMRLFLKTKKIQFLRNFCVHEYIYVIPLFFFIFWPFWRFST